MADDAPNINELVAMLFDIGFIIETAASGRAAIATVAESKRA